jgi:uncharacterized protein (DUF2141 family)
VRIAIVCALALALLPQGGAVAEEKPAGEVQRGTLRVEFTGLRNDNGLVRCALFQTPDGFPGKVEKALATTRGDVHDRRANCEFPDVPAGIYAVIAYHDENSNSHFDRNWLGLPKEGHATSNDVVTHFSVPKFRDAEFYFAGSSLTITARMMY